MAVEARAREQQLVKVMLSQNPLEKVGEFARKGELHLPKKVGLIADGNGRWAESKGLTTTQGHVQGGARVEEFFQHSEDLPGTTGAFAWLLSPDNVRGRSNEELAGIHGIVVDLTRRTGERLDKTGGKFIHLGSTEGLPNEISDALSEEAQRTQDNDGFQVGIGYLYDGDTTLVAGMRTAIKDLQGVDPDTRTDDELLEYLDPHGFGQVDMLIRTASDGDPHLSGLGRIADRAQLHFPSTQLPDFDELAYAEELVDFGNREKRHGGRPAINGQS